MFLDTGALLRGADGQFAPSIFTPMERFAAKCRFDPFTGCVIWTAGTSGGRGNSTKYGVFRDGDRRWFAHRWAAMHIHGFDLSGGLTVGHCCPHTHDKRPNSLCVEHLEMQTLSENVAERNVRVAATLRAAQSALQKQYWLFVDRGFEPAPPVTAGSLCDPEAMPIHAPPAWLVPFLPKVECADDCPF